MLEKKTYKNWNQLCEAMNWATTRGDTKVKHLKQLDSMCKYHKEGNKIVIDEIYTEQKEVGDSKGRKPKYLPYTEPLLLSMLNDSLIVDEHGNPIKIGIFTYAELRTSFFDLKASDFQIKDKLKKSYDFVNNEAKLYTWAKEVEAIIRSKTKKVIKESTLELLKNKECYNIDFNYLRVRSAERYIDIKNIELNQLVANKERVWCDYHNRCTFALNKNDRQNMQEYVIEQVKDKLICLGFKPDEIKSYQKAIKIKYTARVKKELQQEINRIRAELRYLVYKEIFSNKIDLPKQKNEQKNYEISFKIEYFLSITNLF